MAKAATSTMKDLVERAGSSLVPYRARGVVEGEIIAVSPRKVLVNIKDLAMGIVPESEFSFDTLELKPGDKVMAYVLSMENEDGRVILSLRRADRERLWKTLGERHKSGETMTVKVKDANRGGLIVEAGGLDGFLPVSQLNAEHYPKIETGNFNQIVGKLYPLISKNLTVKIIGLDKETNKLIVSEKATQSLLEETMAETVKVGDVLEAVITGIAQFGLFVKTQEIEGLVHISEVSWDRIENLSQLFKIGDKVKVKVIKVEGNRISLSIKRLNPDPWVKEAKLFQPGQIIQGKVTRLVPFGAFVRLKDKPREIDGLAHISELGSNITDPSQVLEMDKSYPFEIKTVESESHKINLKLIQEDAEQPDKKPAQKKKAKK